MRKINLKLVRNSDRNFFVEIEFRRIMWNGKLFENTQLFIQHSILLKGSKLIVDFKEIHLNTRRANALFSKDKLLVQLSTHWKKKLLSESYKVFKAFLLIQLAIFCADSRVRLQENSIKCKSGTKILPKWYENSNAK